MKVISGPMFWKRALRNWNRRRKSGSERKIPAMKAQM